MVSWKPKQKSKLLHPKPASGLQHYYVRWLWLWLWLCSCSYSNCIRCCFKLSLKSIVEINFIFKHFFFKRFQRGFSTPKYNAKTRHIALNRAEQNRAEQNKLVDIYQRELLKHLKTCLFMPTKKKAPPFKADHIKENVKQMFQLRNKVVNPSSSQQFSCHSIGLLSKNKKRLYKGLYYQLNKLRGINFNTK